MRQSIRSSTYNEGIEVISWRILQERKLCGIQLDDGLAIALNDALHGTTRCNWDSEF